MKINWPLSRKQISQTIKAKAKSVTDGAYKLSQHYKNKLSGYIWREPEDTESIKELNRQQNLTIHQQPQKTITEEKPKIPEKEYKRNIRSVKNFFNIYQDLYRKDKSSVLDMKSTSLKAYKPFREIFTSGVPIQNINFEESDIQRNNFQTVKLKNISFLNSNLNNNDFSLSTLLEVDLRGCKLKKNTNRFASSTVLENTKIDKEDFKYLKEQGAIGSVLIEVPGSNGKEFKQFSLDYDYDNVFFEKFPDPTKLAHRKKVGSVPSPADLIKDKETKLSDTPTRTIETAQIKKVTREVAPKEKVAKPKKDFNPDDLLSIRGLETYKPNGEKTKGEMKRLWVKYHNEALGKKLNEIRGKNSRKIHKVKI